MVPDFFKMVPDLPQKLGAAGPAGPNCFDSIRKHCAGAVFSHNALEVTAQVCSVATVRPSHARPCTLHWFLALRCPWFLRILAQAYKAFIKLPPLSTHSIALCVLTSLPLQLPGTRPGWIFITFSPVFY